MTNLRAVLCGLGNIAWRFDQPPAQICLSHAGAYQRAEKTTLVAGFSPEQGDRDAFGQAFSLPAYGSLVELLERERPDIVSICSPAAAHFAQVMTCLEQEVPMIWLEKPPTLTLAEADLLLAKAATGSSTVLVNYQRRYLPIYQELRRRFLAQTPNRDRRIQVIYSRGLETNGTHMLDLLFFLLGEQAEANLHWVSAGDDPDNPSFALTISGVEVVVNGMSLPYHNIDIAITNDVGRLSVLHGGMSGVVENKIEHELFPGFYRLQTVVDCGFAALAGLAHGMENALADLLASHAAHRSPLSNLHSARQTMTLIAEVRRWQTDKGCP